MYLYSKKEAYLPIWKTDTIYNETVVMIKEDSEMPCGNLLFEPTKIISVKDFTLGYTFNKDEYIYENGKLSLTKNSTCPFLTIDQINGIDMPDGFGLVKNDSGLDDLSISFTTGTGIVKHQIAVTYKHNDKWRGPITEYMGDKLPNVMNKLNNGEDMKIVLIGDSIAAGCGSSGDLTIEPYLDPIGSGFVNEIRDNFKSKIEFVNKSQGGTMSYWGKGEAINRVASYNPDLVVIAFGMNDGAAGVKPEEYKSNIEHIIKVSQDKNPDTEFILISTILANPITKQDHMQLEYVEMHIELTKEYNGVVNVDMSNFTKELFKRKRGADILANHINHPSDFLVRGYVMNLVSVLVK